MFAIAEKIVTIALTASPEPADQANPDALAEGYRRLACAIVGQAVIDARWKPRGQDKAIIARRTWEAIKARAWLAGPACAELLEALDIARGPVLAWLAELPALEQPETPYQEESEEVEA